MYILSTFTFNLFVRFTLISLTIDVLASVTGYGGYKIYALLNQAHRYTIGHRMTKYVITYLPIGKEDRRQIWSALDVLRT